MLYFFIIATACHNNEKLNKPETKASAELQNVLIVQNQPQKDTKHLFSKTVRQAIYFAKSLEREALKLLLKEEQIQRQTLFSVISYAVESNSGSKKSVPPGLDCSRYELKKNKDDIFVYKACVTPSVEVAVIKVIAEDRDYEFNFKIREWAKVLGPSAVFTGQNIRCRLKILDQKLNYLSCQDWTHQVSEEQLSSTVIKTNEFLFQRNATQQFVIRGGFYKELIQNKKIDIEVPLEGKIKIIEKEIKVIDEFLEQTNGALNGEKEKSNEKQSENSTQKTEDEKSTEETSQKDGSQNIEFKKEREQAPENEIDKKSEPEAGEKKENSESPEASQSSGDRQNRGR